MANVCKQFDDDSGRLPARGCPRQAAGGGVFARAVLGLCWAVMLVLGISLSAAQTADEAEINREYPIKAAYLYNFSRYVQWPANAFPTAETPFVIGVLGSDPFGDVLDDIARTKKVEGRQIVVKQVASMSAYTPCHILFLPASADPQQKAAAIKMGRGLPVLLVGESRDFAQQGGDINFFVEENKVRFEINPEAAKQARLRISSKLLSLAKIVGGLQP